MKSFKDLTIGQKIGLGFGVIMAMLAIVSIFSYSSASQIADSIPGKILDGSLAQKEVDHLNWINQVSALLTDDNVTTLQAETDPNKCAFGQWLHGEERHRAEEEIPSLAPMLTEIEAYHANLHNSASEVAEHYKPADASLPSTLRAREVDHMDWADKISRLFMENLPELEIQTDPDECPFGKWLNSEEAKRYTATDPKFARLLDAVRAPHKNLHASAVEIQNAWIQRHKGLRHTLKDRLEEIHAWSEAICRACILENWNSTIETEAQQSPFGRFLDSDQCKQWISQLPALKTNLDACRKSHEHLCASAKKIQKSLTSGDSASAKRVYTDEMTPEIESIVQHLGEAIAAETVLETAQQTASDIYEKHTLPALDQTRTALHACQQYATAALDGAHMANEVFATKTKPNLEKTQGLIEAIREEVRAHIMSDQEILDTSDKAKTNVLWTGAGAFVIGIVLALFISRGIVQTLTRIIQGLTEGADQVNDAANQVAGASQMLAEGASEQASSLEETSAALEEMAAMTRTNAENAKQADGLSTQAREAAQAGNATMRQLNEAMTGINESSDKISKIIKVIEEIAFQTNLLALNAAVEAARAGEHGKGFAVVANEVRNLAQRAAEAAGETTSLIEDSVNKAQAGTAVAQDVGKALGTIVTDVTKVTDLINGIAKASDEQAQGAQQVNTAVGQMDKVTQQNAAGAEESASAAEELSAQAATVKEMVEELSVLVGSRDSRTKAQQTPTSTPMHNRPTSPGPMRQTLAKSQRSTAPARPSTVTAGSMTAKAGDFMPMDDTDEGIEEF